MTIAINNAQIQKVYKAEVTFGSELVFLIDSKADAEFKKVFATSLLEAKTHAEHWQDTRSHMKEFAEKHLSLSLPDIGFWKPVFKHKFKTVLESIEDHAS